MQKDLFEFFEIFESVLESISILIEDNPDLKHKIVVQRKFYDVKMKFDYLSDDISLKYNYMDYIAAIDIVVNRGYASIAEISRKLGLIYQQSFRLVELMEEEGIVIKGLPPKGRYGARILNPDYDPESPSLKL